MGIPPIAWFIRENPIKMDDLELPPFQETSIFGKPINQLAKSDENRDV